MIAATRTRLVKLVIYPKEVQLITGQQIDAARRLLHKIRKSLNKKSTHYITIHEFSQYTGIRKEEILDMLERG